MPPPAKKRRALGGSEVARALAWLDNYRKVSQWMEQYDIESLIDQGGGIAWVRGFLPEFVAEGALRILEALPPGRWNDTAADEDYTHNNIAHRFWSVKAGTGASSSGGGGSAGQALESLMRAFTLLMPDRFNAFSAARYERDHHIAPHDDRAYTPVLLDTGEVLTCSRDVTVVYYLTKDWEESMGGALIDLEAPPEPGAGKGAGSSSSSRGSSSGGQGNAEGQRQHNGRQQGQRQQGQRQQGQRQQGQQEGRMYVPEFNAAVFFRVPRYHAVTPLLTDRPRFSVFGWFLQPGKLYDLYTGGDRDPGQAQGQGLGQSPRRQLEGAGARGHDNPQQQQQQQDKGRGQRDKGGQAAGAGRRGKAGGGQEKQGKHGDLSAGQREQIGQMEQLGQQGVGLEAGDNAALPAIQCKLAQRLLGKLAAKQRRRQ